MKSVLEVEVQDILESVSEGVVLQDRTGRFVFVNDAAANMMGFTSASKFMRMPADTAMERFRVFDKEGKPFPLDQLPGKRILSGETADPVTLKWVNLRTGQERWYLCMAKPVPDTHGVEKYALNVFTDISNARDAAVDAALSAKWLTNILDIASVGIITTDQHGTIQTATSTVERIFGYQPGEVVGQDVSLLLPAPRRVEPLAYPHNYFGTSAEVVTGSVVKVKGKRKDGSTFPVTFGLDETNENGERSYMGYLWDREERERSERALTEYAEKARLAIKAGDFGIWEYNPGAKTSSYDARCRELFELPATGELGVDGLIERIHPDDYAHVETAFFAALDPKVGGKFDEEFRLALPSGKLRWIASRGEVTFTGKGKRRRPLRYIGTLRDITNRKQAIEDLRVSEERYRAVVESQAELVSRFRPDGTILFVNNAYANARGTTPEKLIGRSLWDFVKKDEQAGVQAMLDQLRPESPEVVIENHFETKEGLRWTLWTNRGLVFDEDGHATEFQSTGVDITDRKRSEQALAESEAHLREIYENAGVGISTIGLNRRWLKVNKRFCEIVGYSEEELIGREVFGLSHEDDRAISPQTAALHRGEVSHADLEKRYIHRDGHTVWVKVTSSVHKDLNGKAQYWISIVEDITARKQVEMRLVAEHAVSQVLATARNMDEAAPLVLDALRETLGSDVAELWLPDEDGQSIHRSCLRATDAIKKRKHWNQWTAVDHLKAGEGLPGTVWEKQSSDWQADIITSPPSPRKGLGRKIGIVSNKAFPLKAGERSMGVICLLSSQRLVTDDGREESLASLGQDIGQFMLRQQAEQALKENEERLRLASDAGGIGVWDWNITTGRASWSEGQERIFGLPPGTFDGTAATFLGRIHPEDRGRMRKLVESAYEGEADHLVEYRIVRPTGEIRWLYCHGTAVFGPTGQPVRIFGVVIDITDRKREEESHKLLTEASNILASSLDYEETLRAVAGIAVPSPADWCAVDLVRPDGSIHRVAVAHKDPAKVELGMELTRRYPPAESDALQTMLASGQPVIVPVVTEEMIDASDRDATYKNMLKELGLKSVMIVPLLSGNETLGALTLIASESGRIYDDRDLEMAKELAHRCALAIQNARLYTGLRESEGRFRTTFENAAAGVAHLGLDGKFLRVNQKLGEITGYRQDELLDRSLPGITHPDDLEVELAQMRCLLKGEINQYTIEKRYVRADGSPVWASVTGSLARMPDETPDYFITVVLEISRRKELEERLKQSNTELETRVEERTVELEALTTSLRMLAARLTQAEQGERRRLAALIHDDLQQLLVAARMQVTTLNPVKKAPGKSARPSGPEERAISYIDQAIEAARTLTTQLRPPALYESGLAASLGWLAAWMKQAHSFRVELKLDESAQHLTETDTVLLFDSVREILLNAVKHSGSDTATVSLRELDDQQLLLSISDNGQGFDVASLDRPRTKSGGFGLFSIRERMIAIGGRFEMLSTPGEGTTVNLYWPKTAPEDNMSVEQLRRGAHKAGGSNSTEPRLRADSVSVLLVDDHALLRQSLADALERQPDIQVIAEAADGEEAVEAVNAYRPQIVVMDVNMPRLNGMQSTRIIKERFPGVRIIGLSVHNDSATRQAMLDSGASAYLSKDGPIEMLIETIRRQASKTPAPM